jgi:hypothetical protein
MATSGRLTAAVIAVVLLICSAAAAHHHHGVAAEARSTDSSMAAPESTSHETQVGHDCAVCRVAQQVAALAAAVARVQPGAGDNANQALDVRLLALDVALLSESRAPPVLPAVLV